MTPPSFHALVDEYLELRRGLGFAADGLRWHLRAFARYADRIGHKGPITVALAASWAIGPCPECQGSPSGTALGTAKGSAVSSGSRPRSTR